MAWYGGNPFGDSMTNLVERDLELTAIEAFVREGGVMLIEAGAGVGKTAMLEAACACARRERRLVMRARGSNLERDFAFGMARQLFERRCAHASPEEKDLLLAGPARPALMLFQRQDSISAEQDTGFAVLHGLYWLTISLADPAPLLLAVDDAHWADEATLRWLAYLAPRLSGPHVALVATLRADEPASRSSALVAVRAAATTMRLRLLSRQAVAIIVRDMLGMVDDAVIETAHRVTGGNPFYLPEVLRALHPVGNVSNLRAIEQLPGSDSVEGVARYIGARLQALDPAGLRLAQALAILGDDCELRHAAAVADVAMERATDLASELVRLEVLGQ